MERETGIEPASLAWKARVLPLNYSRKTEFRASTVQRLQTTIWWRGLDSNQCRRKPTDLQSAPFSHSGTPPKNLEVYSLFDPCVDITIFCFRRGGSLFSRWHQFGELAVEFPEVAHGRLLLEWAAACSVDTNLSLLGLLVLYGLR